MLHPDFMIQIENKRLQDFRNDATDCHLAKIAQGDKSDRFKGLINSVFKFAKNIKSQSVTKITEQRSVVRSDQIV